MSTVSLAESSSGDSFLITPSAGLIAWTVFAFALWLAFAFAVGRFARSRGQSFGLFFAASLVFSPLLMVGVLLVLPRYAPSHGR